MPICGGKHLFSFYSPINIVRYKVTLTHPVNYSCVSRAKGLNWFMHRNWSGRDALKISYSNTGKNSTNLPKIIEIKHLR